MTVLQTTWRLHLAIQQDVHTDVGGKFIFFRQRKIRLFPSTPILSFPSFPGLIHVSCCRL